MGIEINSREIKLLTTKREGKTAFWFEFAPRDRWNLGDVPPKMVPIGYLPDLLRRAFDMGVMAQKDAIQQHLFATDFKVTQEDPDGRD